MLKGVLFSVLAVFFGLGILAVSIFRSATPALHAYHLPPTPGPKDQKVLGDEDVSIDYFFSYPGRVLPDNPLWPIKALRDKLWIFVTTNTSKKAELLLLFADKRLVSARILYEREKPEVALSTLTKAEKYLEEATIAETKSRQEGGDTSELLLKLSMASLKHMEVIEELLEIAPADSKPEIIRAKDYSKRAYEKAMHGLNEKGMEVPGNPFEN